MNYLLFYFSIFLISTSLTFSQTVRIVRIIQPNIFELENSQKVKIYGLYIPSKTDTNKIFALLSSEISNWEKSFLLNRDFRIEYVKKDVQGISEVIFYKTYALTEENIANRFLSNGYAYILTETEENYYNQLLPFQEKAQNNSVGIWKPNDINITEISKLDNPINERYGSFKHFERPYLPLLAISVASFALAWDGFSSADELQNSIDAFKKLNVNTSKLESAKTRKTVVGVACIIAGIVTTFFAFESFEVKSDFNSVSLNYKF